MKKTLAATFFASVLSVSAVLASLGEAQAMPIAPLQQEQSAQAPVIQVFGGCGAGWHRGPYGGCRPLYNCPPGWHTGPYGRRCFRNW